MKCPHCNAQAEADSFFCDQCGESLPQEAGSESAVAKAPAPVDQTEIQVDSDAAQAGVALLHKWVWIGVGMVLGATVMGQVLPLTSGLHPHKASHLVGGLFGLVFSLFLYWNIYRCENWARRLYIVFCAFAFFWLPLLVSLYPVMAGFLAHPARTMPIYMAFVAASGLFRMMFSFVLFMPAVRSLFIANRPDPAERVVLGIVAVVSLGFGLLTAVSIRVWLGTVSIKNGQFVAAPWVNKKIQEQSLENHRQAEWLTGFKMPDWGHMTAAASEGDFALMGYEGMNQKQSIYVFSSEPAREAPLEKMLVTLDKKATEESTLVVGGEKIVKSVSRQWTDMTPKVIQTMTLPTQGRPTTADRLFFPQESAYQDGLKVRLLKADRIFTVVGVSAGGSFSEAAFVDFINQLNNAPRALGPDGAPFAPKSPQQWLAQGQRGMKFGHYREAIRDFQECIRLEPNNRQAYQALSHAYMDSNEFDKAQAIDMEIKKRWLNEGGKR